MEPNSSSLELNGSYVEPNHSSLDLVPVNTEWIRTRVDPIPNGSEHFRSRVNIALVSLDSSRQIIKTRSNKGLTASAYGIDGPTFVPKSGYFLLIWVKICLKSLPFLNF